MIEMERDPRAPVVGNIRLGAVASLVVAVALSEARRRLGQSRFAAASSASATQAAHHRGREASLPTEIPARGWWDILRRTVDEVGHDRILAVAAGVTFYGLLALFPAVGAFVSLYGLVADPSTIGNHLSNLAGLLPDGAIQIVSEQVGRITSKGQTALGFAFFSGLAISLWSANAGMKAIFDALNIAYDEEEKRNLFWLNVQSLFFTLAAVTFLAVALSAVVVIPVVLKFVGLGDLTEWIIWAGRWPALLIVTLGAIATLYRYGPSRRKAQWLWLSPGAALAGAGWMATSMLFSWYVSSFGSYNETYGSLGAVIGFMTWLWISVTIILVGAELNAEIEHQTAVDTTRGPGRPLGQRGATMADRVAASH